MNFYMIEDETLIKIIKGQGKCNCCHENPAETGALLDRTREDEQFATFWVSDKCKTCNELQTIVSSSI